MSANLGRNRTECALEAASSRSLDQVDARADPAAGEQGIINRVRGDPLRGRPVDVLEGAAEEVRNDGGNAVDASSADDVEESHGKLRERGTDAPTCHNYCPVPSE